MVLVWCWCGGVGVVVVVVVMQWQWWWYVICCMVSYGAVWSYGELSFGVELCIVVSQLVLSCKGSRLYSVSSSAHCALHYILWCGYPAYKCT